MAIRFVDIKPSPEPKPAAAPAQAVAPSTPPAVTSPPKPKAKPTSPPKEKEPLPASPPKEPKKPSPALASIVGSDPIPRTEVISRLWAYIKANKLQLPTNGRIVICDDKLKRVFGHERVTIFEMNKLLGEHLS